MMLFKQARLFGVSLSLNKTKSKITKNTKRLAYCAVFSLVLFILPLYKVSAQESVSENKFDLEQRLQDLENESKDLDGQLQKVRVQSRSLSSEIKSLDIETKKKDIEIQRLNLSVRKAELGIANKTENIKNLTDKIANNQKALTASLLSMYVSDREDKLTVMIAKNKTVLDFFSSVYDLGKDQPNIDDKIRDFRDSKTDLEKEKVQLEDYKQEQEDLKALQEIEKRVLTQKKKDKDEILRLTKGKESVFQDLLKSKNKDITGELKSQLFYLSKTGISVQDALSFAEEAAKKTGIRPAFLLALLEVETGKNFEGGKISAGTNLGTGNWKKDMYECYIKVGKRQMAESQKKAFMEITSRLGFDPDDMQVSKKPNYGCGGAMGPAQFLPTTWISYEDKISELTGHANPNPWNTEDAFMGAALLLSDAGADSKDIVGEVEAANVYISGKAVCTKSICNWYSSQIIGLSRDIDDML